MSKAERESNFELMRIISMFLIVVWHVIIHGKIFDNSGEVGLFVANVILGIIAIHVNSLVFLTGYYNNDKTEVKTKKIFKLIGTAWFYKATIVIIFFLLGLEKTGKITFMEELLPLDINNYWFVNAYIIIYLLSPYLNKVTENMTEKDFGKMIVKLIILLTILPLITNNRFISNNGSNIINFVIIYYLGSFFRKYPINKNYHFKSLERKKLRTVLIIMFFSMALMNISIKYLGDKMYIINSEILNYYGSIIRNNYLYYSNPLIIVQSCAYCLLFETLNIKSKIINFISGSTFGVYLIHDNHLIRKVLYQWVNKVINPSTFKMMGILILSSTIIFLACFIIETIRRMLARGLEMVYTIVRKKKAN